MGLFGFFSAAPKEAAQVHTPPALQGDVAGLRTKLTGTLLCFGDENFETEPPEKTLVAGYRKGALVLRLSFLDCTSTALQLTCLLLTQGYEAARFGKTWLRDPVVFGYPAAIVSVKCAEDISHAIKFAAAQKVNKDPHELMAICVAGGRHTKSSMLSDRLCIDLTTYMNEVVVDAETQTATAKGGTTLAALDSYSCIYTMRVTSCAGGISLPGAQQLRLHYSAT
eukprot:10664-Heterococcus_DN1.PRE.1